MTIFESWESIYYSWLHCHWYIWYINVRFSNFLCHFHSQPLSLPLKYCSVNIPFLILQLRRPYKKTSKSTLEKMRKQAEMGNSATEILEKCFNPSDPMNSSQGMFCKYFKASLMLDELQSNTELKPSICKEILLTTGYLGFIFHFLIA